jgi:hypothetical protein
MRIHSFLLISGIIMPIVSFVYSKPTSDHSLPEGPLIVGYQSWSDCNAMKRLLQLLQE